MPMLTEGSPGSTEIHRSGERITEARPGSLYCAGCGFAFPLASVGSLPECPNCGGSRFHRAALFDRRPTVDSEAVTIPATAPDWLLEARAEIDRAGRYLAFEEVDGARIVIRLDPGWTRIGR